MLCQPFFVAPICLSFSIFHLYLLFSPFCLILPTTKCGYSCCPWPVSSFFFFFLLFFFFSFVSSFHIPVQVKVYKILCYEIYFFENPPILLLMVKFMAMVAWYDYLIILPLQVYSRVHMACLSILNFRLGCSNSNIFLLCFCSRNYDLWFC